MEQAVMVSFVVTQRMITRYEHVVNRREGIEKTKMNGKYIGRKLIEVDEQVLCQVK